jgi:hypothetical protein
LPPLQTGSNAASFDADRNGLEGWVKAIEGPNLQSLHYA